MYDIYDTCSTRRPDARDMLSELLGCGLLLNGSGLTGDSSNSLGKEVAVA